MLSGKTVATTETQDSDSTVPLNLSIQSSISFRVKKISTALFCLKPTREFFGLIMQKEERIRKVMQTGTSLSEEDQLFFNPSTYMLRCFEGTSITY